MIKQSLYLEKHIGKFNLHVNKYSQKFNLLFGNVLIVIYKSIYFYIIFNIFNLDIVIV